MRFIDFDWWKTGAVLTAMAVLCVLYGPVILHPDNFLFGAGGDAVKNYFTFAWHVKYDNDWLHFGGSNYPYGEHVGYTDGHPLFSLLLGWIPLVKQYPVATLNIFMLSSHIITVIVVYDLLKKWSVVPFVAALGALSITWLQPQLFRMEGHLSLSYAWAIPLTILLLTRFWTERKRLTLLILCLFIFLVFLIHPYLGMMLSMLVFVFAITILLAARFKPCDSGDWLRIAISGIVPALLFMFFMKMTDPHAERPEKAIGFLTTTSGYDEVFVPNHKPFRHLISQIIKVEGQLWEGWAYIGLATIVILIIYSIKSIFIRKNPVKKDMLPRLIFTSSIIILLFAFGFPFAYGFEWLLEKVPFVDQFRAPGRFAWIFYFGATLFSFYTVNSWIVQWRNNSKKTLPIIIPITVSALFLIEGYMAQTTVAQRILKTPNNLTSRSDSAFLASVREIQEMNVCGIVPIPFFHYGSDYYAVHSDEQTVLNSYALALQTGIPLLASSNPRVSLLESRNLLNLFAPFYFNKPIWNDFKDERCKFYIYSVNNFEESIIPKGVVLQLDSSQLLYEEFNDACYRRDWTSVKQMASKYLDVDLLDIQYNSSFDYLNPVYAKSEDTIFLRKFAPGELVANEHYIASIKLAARDLYKVRAMLVLESRKDVPENLVSSHSTMSPMIYGDSLILELPFTIQDSSIGYSIFIKGSDDLPEDYMYSQFFVRKANELWMNERKDTAGQSVLFVNGVALTRFND